MTLIMMHPTLYLIYSLASLCLAHPTAYTRSAQAGHLVLADEGIGHRSTPIPEWPTSLRKLGLNGSDPAILTTYGQAASESPLGAISLAYDESSRRLFLASGSSIIRSEVDGSNPTTILNDPAGDYLTSLVVGDGHLFYGTGSQGLIKRANLDGSDVVTIRNVSQGIDTSLSSFAYSSASGIAIDTANDLIYWSSDNGPGDFGQLPNGGSIRRAPLSGNSDADIEVIAQNIYRPKQMRLLANNTLYWVESNQYFDSPTALKRAKVPATKITVDGSVPTQALLGWTFTEYDPTPYKLSSFAVDETRQQMWLTALGDAAQAYAWVAATTYDDAGVKTPVVLSQNTSNVGVPVGIEYIA